MSEKLYRTIMMDPPWQGQGAERHYKTMSLDSIRAMPIADLADPNSSHLWIWLTNSTIRHGYDLMEAYGYTPRNLLTWAKPRLGLGSYLRCSSEHVLLGTRGKAPVRFKSQPTWMFAPVQDHSHKPEEIYDVIERVSPGPYLELFARRPRHGWAAWGDMIDSDVDIPGYPVPSSPATRRTS